MSVALVRLAFRHTELRQMRKQTGGRDCHSRPPILFAAPGETPPMLLAYILSMLMGVSITMFVIVIVRDSADVRFFPDFK